MAPSPFGGHPTLLRLLDWLQSAGCSVEVKVRNHSITGQPYQSLEVTSPTGSRAVLVNPNMDEHLSPSMVSYFQRRLAMQTPFPAEPEQPSNVVEYIPVPDTDEDPPVS
jgi:hypothetical protein